MTTLTQSFLCFLNFFPPRPVASLLVVLIKSLARPWLDLASECRSCNLCQNAWLCRFPEYFPVRTEKAEKQQRHHDEQGAHASPGKQNTTRLILSSSLRHLLLQFCTLEKNFYLNVFFNYFCVIHDIVFCFLGKTGFAKTSGFSIRVPKTPENMVILLRLFLKNTITDFNPNVILVVYSSYFLLKAVGGS